MKEEGKNSVSYFDSKAGFLGEALSYPRDLINNPLYEKEIPQDKADEVKRVFLEEIANIAAKPNYGYITQTTLDKVQERAEQIDWTNSEALSQLTKFIVEELRSLRGYFVIPRSLMED